jgi:hypothetical protein
MADASHSHQPDDKFIRVERMALFELLDRFPAQLRLDDLIGRVTRFKAEPGFGDTEEVREGVAELLAGQLRTVQVLARVEIGASAGIGGAWW